MHVEKPSYKYVRSNVGPKMASSTEHIIEFDRSQSERKPKKASAPSVANAVPFLPETLM